MRQETKDGETVRKETEDGETGDRRLEKGERRQELPRVKTNANTGHKVTCDM